MEDSITIEKLEKAGFEKTMLSTSAFLTISDDSDTVELEVMINLNDKKIGCITIATDLRNDIFLDIKTWSDLMTMCRFLGIKINE